ncbi:MAG: hypothetical protein R3257_01580 [bacterium]|nr:hypothetical protein [bacterium]
MSLQLEGDASVGLGIDFPARLYFLPPFAGEIHLQGKTPIIVLEFGGTLEAKVYFPTGKTRNLQ